MREPQISLRRVAIVTEMASSILRASTHLNVNNAQFYLFAEMLPKSELKLRCIGSNKKQLFAFNCSLSIGSKQRHAFTALAERRRRRSLHFNGMKALALYLPVTPQPLDKIYLLLCRLSAGLL